MTTAVHVAGVGPYLDRELSWLAFNARVLALAEDESVPLLERCKFLAIFSQNLDEFFRVRVAGLKDQVAAGVPQIGVGGMSAVEQLAELRTVVLDLVDRETALFTQEIVPALARAGIRMSAWTSLDDDDRKFLETVFDEKVFPVLTPLSVDPGHPFPHISDLSLNLAVMVRDAATGERRFARVKVPALLPRFVVLPDGERFVPLEQVIAAHIQLLFPGMEVECHFPFRVTRNADLTGGDQEADDLLAAVELELRRRRRGRGVRLEVDATMSDEILSLLLAELELEPEDVYVIDGPLDLTGLWAVHALARPDLKDDPWPSVTERHLAAAEGDIFGALQEGDILVHHPYESFNSSVESFIKQAASDRNVLAIKMTLYRTSGDSPIVKALIRAAQANKQVVAIVELKARFDEEANIAWARAMEDAGVHVVYGLVGLKTHAKVALVARLEDEVVRRYSHIGTGNYNPETARLYEDIGLLSADPVLGADLSELFNFLTGYSRNVTYDRLVLAPDTLSGQVVDLIAGQAHPGGRITLKVNSLADPAVIDALYAASQAGAGIDLIVRGICCLRPGVPGISDTIRVRSIVGRYLEHSRILRFGTPGEPGTRYLIGSADLMPRNLHSRVEAMVFVEGRELQGRLDEILDVSLADNTQAWELDGDGRWQRVQPAAGTGAGAEPVAAQRRLHELAVARGHVGARPRRASDVEALVLDDELA
ncbi:MAG TPA: polyphosphate kinase 1 [Acidimicrobiales bacterium]|nr:polyphosphate kinase 1 [Acidimicrobiales bacterium]